MKKRKLISYLLLFWRKQRRNIFVVFDAFFWSIFLVTAGTLFAWMLSQVTGMDIVSSRFVCLTLVLVIRMAITEKFDDES